jgi:predicted metalloprotease with PDZ domain
MDSPAYAAGLDAEDDLTTIAGTAVASTDDLTKILATHKPGDEVELVFKRRTGEEVKAKTTLAEEPRLEVVPIERTGAALTDAQKRFRESWLGSKAATAK